VHNNTHESGPTGVVESVHALISLKSSFQENRQQPEVTGKGKEQANLARKGSHKAEAGPRETWARPPHGWIKVNVDASFVGATECTGAGVVARDSEGRVILTAWRAHNCASVAEAEALACVQGVRLAF
jgi:hypothetical protein